MTKDEPHYTDEMREAFNEAIKDTMIAGHTKGCEHFDAMRDCISIFAQHRFHVGDSIVTWLMLFTEATLILPREERDAFTADMLREIAAIAVALRDLPPSQRYANAERDIH